LFLNLITSVLAYRVSIENTANLTDGRPGKDYRYMTIARTPLKEFLQDPTATISPTLTPKAGQDMTFELRQKPQRRVIEMFDQQWILLIDKVNGEFLDEPMKVGQQQCYTVFSAVTNWFMYDGKAKHICNLKRPAARKRWTYITAKNSKPFYTLNMLMGESQPTFTICRGKVKKGLCLKDSKELYLIATSQFVGMKRVPARDPKDNKITFTDKDGVVKAVAEAFFDQNLPCPRDGYNDRVRYWKINVKDKTDSVAVIQTMDFIEYGQLKKPARHSKPWSHEGKWKN